jgi:enoyl-CoA hydratase
MNDKSVLYETRGHIGLITLNRPDNRNSMDAEMLPVFSEVLDQAKSNRDLRCLVITGSGSSFCAGADLKAGFTDTSGHLLHETMLEVYRHFLKMGEIEIPTIAAMNGHGVGGGFGLALMCDIRVACNTAKYGANFARLGIHPGMAISYTLPRLAGLPKACELLFTGRVFNGLEAATMGLVNYAVEEGSVLDKALELAEEIAGSAPAAVRMMKRTIYRGMNWDPVKAAEIEAQAQSHTLQMEDAAEGISALLEKRKPDFKGK